MEINRRLLDANNKLVHYVKEIANKEVINNLGQKVKFCISVKDIIKNCGGFVTYLEIMDCIDVACPNNFYVKYDYDNEQFVFVNYRSMFD